MAQENLLLKQAKEMGLIDDREVAVGANITCTNGNRGRGWVFLNGTVLSIYEPVGFTGLGDHVETLDLRAARFVKGSTFVLNTTLKLEYAGHAYTFKDFTIAKKFIEAVKEACGQ